MGEQKTESRKFIDKLIAFDTTSYRSNLDLIHTISDYLAEYGIHSQLVFNVEHTKANLFATIGPRDKAGVMLSGHTDVVPVEGQNWSSDPFVVVEKEGALYGRGTADMKSFIAIVLAYVPQLAEANLSKGERITLAGLTRVLKLTQRTRNKQ